jgi:hypothetical protein
VKYSLLNDSKQIFASKYLLYLPSEKQLMKEIERERSMFEIEHRLKELPNNTSEVKTMKTKRQPKKNKPLHRYKIPALLTAVPFRLIFCHACPSGLAGFLCHHES